MAISLLYPPWRFKPGSQANFFEISNGWKIARMAPILTIFGPNESQRCQLKFEKNWAVEKNSARAKTSKNFREKFEKVVPCTVSGEKQNRNGHIMNEGKCNSMLAQYFRWSENMAFLFVFRPKRNTGQLFRTFRESFSTFSPSRKFFRRPKNFSNFSWQRCDSFGPKIVEIGAILAIFQPFEVSKKFARLRFT